MDKKSGRVIDTILNAVSIMIENTIRKAPFDITRWATVTTANADGTYNITMDGKNYTNIKSNRSVAIPINTTVEIKIPNHQYNRMFIVNHLEKPDVIDSVITVSLETPQIIGAEFTKLNFTSEQKIGDKLTMYNGGIKIGAGVSKVKLSSIVSCGNGLVSGDVVYNCLYKGNTLVATLGWEQSKGTICCIASNTIVYPVNDGDEFYIWTKNTGGARGSLSTGYMNSLTMEVVQ